MDELLPCPFCGSRATIGNNYIQFWIDCLSCYVVSRACLKRADAIAAWNRRAAAPPPPTDLVRQALLQNED